MGWPKGKPRKEYGFRQSTGAKPDVLFVVEPEQAPEPLRPGCSNCKFVHFNGSYFECHRYPPPWTKIALTDWCGEHRSD